ncbi:MAG TPA: DUF1830 domain-containing protein [Leptolyngbya sp.]|jgi:hypothetical protein|nr:DUF1830 domain-containing protein [Leptolyngbya sp.]
MTSISCYYTNASSQLQQIRLQNSDRMDFDRMVFPGEKFIFEALPEGWLEIHTHTTTGLQLFQTIACLRLQVLQRQQAELET